MGMENLDFKKGAKEWRKGDMLLFCRTKRAAGVFQMILPIG
jgi:hypothetical protein